MSKFQIAYGLGGEWEDCDATNLSDAEQLAYELACEEYQMYEGLRGLRTLENIMEETIDEREAEYILEEEMESWIDYKVREVK